MPRPRPKPQRLAPFRADYVRTRSCFRLYFNNRSARDVRGTERDLRRSMCLIAVAIRTKRAPHDATRTGRRSRCSIRSPRSAPRANTSGTHNCAVPRASRLCDCMDCRYLSPPAICISRFLFWLQPCGTAVLAQRRHARRCAGWRLHSPLKFQHTMELVILDEAVAIDVEDAEEPV